MTTKDDNDAKVIWKEQFGANTVRNQISAFLNPPAQEGERCSRTCRSDPVRSTTSRT